MDGMSVLRKKGLASALEPRGKSAEKEISGQLRWAAGTEAFQNRDPIFHVTESFQQVFDFLGMERAAGKQADKDLLGIGMKELSSGISGIFPENGKSPGSTLASEPAEATFLKRTSMEPYYEQRAPEALGDRLMNRFSEVAFQRGTLAGAVVQGTGKMMLFSCLKRAAGQSEPKNRAQRKLFQTTSHTSIPAGHVNDRVVFNAGYVNSAVGLVVDILRSSRQVMETMTALAEGKGGMGGGSGAETLRKMYPFLTDDRERGLLGEYQTRLKSLGDGPEHGEEHEILQRAVIKTEALIHKKRQMKVNFIARLKYIASCAQAAAAVFSQDEFRQALGSRTPVLKPPEEPPDTGGGESSDGKEDASADVGDENGAGDSNGSRPENPPEGRNRGSARR